MISLPHHTYSAREKEITQLFTEQHLLPGYKRQQLDYAANLFYYDL